VARGQYRTEGVYRPDDAASFFRDLVLGRNDPDAQERLQRSQREAQDHFRERRDVTSSGGGAGLIPPVYMGELYAEVARPARPFADAVRAQPLPDAGMTITVPKVVTGALVGVQATENTTLAEQDPDVDSVTADVVTIGGFVDISLQTLERSMPGFDVVTFNDLRAGYDSLLDTQLLSGTGSNGQHLGIRAVTSPNTVTYTDATPTGAALLPSIYDGISQIATNRHRIADWVVMHPRRAALLGSQTTTEATLFQQGELFGSPGQQSAGFVSSFGGLQVILDANVGTS
jgi:HK97 family phage major capsid protein